MPTVLDELLVETRVSLAGLQTGIREAEQMAAQAKGRITQELGTAVFKVDTSEATASLRSLSEATTQLHASLTLLRAQLAQPFTVSINTSGIKQAAADIAALRAQMAGLAGMSGLWGDLGGAAQSARTARQSTRTTNAPSSSDPAATATVNGPLMVRSSGALTPIVVNGSVVIAGRSDVGGGSAGVPAPISARALAAMETLPSVWMRSGASFQGMATSDSLRLPSPSGGLVSAERGAIIPPTGSSIAIIPPAARGASGFGSAINMQRAPGGMWTMAGAGAGGVPPWAFTGFGGGSTGAFGAQFVNPGLQWGQQFVPPGQAARFTPLTPPGSPAAAGGGMGLLGSIGTTIAYAAAFGAVYKIVGDIRDVWNEVIEGGQQFNAQMEVGTINIAALLSQTREFKSTSGQTVDTLTNYKLQLGAAANIQKELVRLDAETLGTVHDLQGVFAQVLAHTRGQVATDTQRLQLATGILNASVLMGNSEQQHVIEARQTLTGQSHVGAVILANLGISNKMILAWREQHVEVQKLLERLELFNRLGKDAGSTWEGVTNSLKSLSELMAGTTGKDLFEGQRHALLGQATEMRRQQDAGEVFAMPLAASTAEMELYGQNMARVWLNVNQTIVGLQNSFLTLAVRGVNAAFAIADAWTAAKERMSAWTPDWLEKAGNFLLNPGAVMMGGATPAGIPMTSKGVDDQTADLAYQFRTLNETDTSKMSSTRFSAHLMALAKVQDQITKLKTVTDQLHGTNQITEADYKRISDNLKNFSDGVDESIHKFESPIAPDKKEGNEEKLLRARESAQSAANSAELSLAQRRATITGNTTEMQRMAEQRVEDERDRALRRAGDDIKQRTDIWRKYYADKANLEIDATQRDIANSRRVGQIDEQESQRKLRAIQEQGRAQAFMTQAELSSVRRQIGIAQNRGASPEILNPLFRREAGLIEQDRTQTIARAQEQAAISNAAIAAKQREIDQFTALAAAAQKDPVVSGIYREHLDYLNNQLITWQSHATAAGQAQVTANERAADAALRNAEAVRLLNRSIGERVGDTLRKDSQGHTDQMADIAVRGVYRISDALSDMAAKGKFSFKSLVQAASEMSNDITRELMREAFRRLLMGAGGQTAGGGMGGAEGGLGFLGAALFGGGGTRASVMAGGAPRSYMPPADAAQVQWQLATAGIQQIAQTGTMATQALTQASSGSFSLLASLAQSIISSISAMATGSSASSGGGGFLSILGSFFGGGGASFGNVASGGSSTAAFLERGGMVPHFANGGFAGNEVPAILHKGEMVLSAAETRNLMRYGSAKLPISGGGGARSHSGGHNTIVHMTVNTPDANSFMRNQAQIESSMARRLQYSGRRNG